MPLGSESVHETLWVSFHGWRDGDLSVHENTHPPIHSGNAAIHAAAMPLYMQYMYVHTCTYMYISTYMYIFTYMYIYRPLDMQRPCRYSVNIKTNIFEHFNTSKTSIFDLLWLTLVMFG